jgi:hypothetical protein
MEDTIFRAVMTKLCREVGGFNMQPSVHWVSSSKLGKRRQPQGGCVTGKQKFIEDERWLVATITKGRDKSVNIMVALKKGTITVYPVNTVDDSHPVNAVGNPLDIGLGDPELVDKLKDELTEQWKLIG